MSDSHTRFEAASKKLRDQLPVRQGGQAAENDYSAAYQSLVSEGAAPQIRRRYRVYKPSKSVR